jgi:hypothetical protein
MDGFLNFHKPKSVIRDVVPLTYAKIAKMFNGVKAIHSDLHAKAKLSSQISTFS